MKKRNVSYQVSIEGFQNSTIDPLFEYDPHVTNSKRNKEFNDDMRFLIKDLVFHSKKAYLDCCNEGQGGDKPEDMCKVRITCTVKIEEIPIK